MLQRIVLPVIAAALAAVLIPSEVRAYGAAHVGYTHVGPNGVYHAGATEVRGGYGGAGAYHAGYGGASYGGGYHYSAGYSGGAAYGGYHYEYVR